MSIEVVFFGTGSGRPMPYRNVAGMAMVRQGQTFLFDCGECTQVRLIKSPIRPGSIDAVFLTHYHGDHCNGLPGLLGTLALNQREEPIDVYAPTGLKQWFRTMSQLGMLRVDRFARLNEFQVDAPTVLYSHQDFDVVAAPLEHRVTCYGFALVEHARPGRFDLERARELKIPPGPLYGKLQRGESVTLDDGRVILPSDVMGASRSGLKIAYCTDTIPSKKTVELARGADLLIHEATYPGGLEQEAHSRGHSTSTDAAKIALEAGVKRLVLTHFSQAYYDLAPFLDGARKIFPNVEAATDLSSFEVVHAD